MRLEAPLKSTDYVEMSASKDMNMEMPQKEWNWNNIIIQLNSCAHIQRMLSQCTTCTSTSVLSVSLFTVARISTHPRRPATDGQTKKTCGMYKMELYSTIKRKVKSWYLQENGRNWSEINQTQKNTLTHRELRFKQR